MPQSVGQAIFDDMVNMPSSGATGDRIILPTNFHPVAVGTKFLLNHLPYPPIERFAPTIEAVGYD